jgi:hypothetical protein
MVSTSPGSATPGLESPNPGPEESALPIPVGKRVPARVARRRRTGFELQQCPRQVMVIELDNVIWSDWGNPERIAATLRQLGYEPEACWAHMAAVAG